VNSSAYFAVWDIYHNDIIGDTWLAIIVGLIIVFYVLSKYNFTFQASILIGMLYLGVIYAIVLNPLIWVIDVLLAGTIFYYAISSKLRSG